MVHNVGRTDRLVRTVAGVALVALALGSATGVVALNTIAGGVAFWVGLLLVVTALLGRCPVYDLVGLNTTRAKRQL